MEIIDVGSVVMLKSGGPRMTVEGINDQDVFVSWFSGFEVKKASFASKALKKVDGAVTPTF